jgi:ATP-binding cassette subfamily B protein
MIVLGFLLTVLGTAASLVPPYLTIPLIDQVLIPYSNGQPYDPQFVYWLLAGLAVAAFVAWVLDWAKTYVLAWVSERISADMRNRTYRHLQEMSLEFFGGKRTGDLMSRVGSDSDRICNFLSLNLVDFAADILMIAMTSVILIVIEWRLALVALIPFPFIVLLVHWVRQRLRRGCRPSGVAWARGPSCRAYWPTRFPASASSKRSRRKSAKSSASSAPTAACWRPTIEST